MIPDPSSLSKLVPGFDFLEGLVKNAGAAIPGMGQWVAPTVDPAELDKRIQELRTVQYWLEQNARMLGATIQALEVQRMTLSTLQNMNVQMTDLRDSLLIPLTAAAAAAGPAKAAAPARSAPTPATASAKAPPAKKAAPADGAPAGAPAKAVDPMQWWGALTRQFTELAAAALKDGGAGAAKTLAAATVEPAAKAAAAPRKAAARPAARATRPVPRQRAGT